MPHINVIIKYGRELHEQIIKDIDLLYSQHREAEGQSTLWPGEQHTLKLKNLFLVLLEYNPVLKEWHPLIGDLAGLGSTLLHKYVTKREYGEYKIQI